MGKLWNWLREPLNLAVVTAIGGGLGFLWVQVINPVLHPPAPAPLVVVPAPAPAPITQTATADGGVAVNNNGGSTQIGDSAAPDAATAPTSSPPANQNANAKNGGTAVNNSGGRVVVKRGDQPQ